MYLSKSSGCLTTKCNIYGVFTSSNDQTRTRLLTKNDRMVREVLADVA